MVSYCKLATVFIGLSIITIPCWTARILAILPVAIYSHQSYFYPLWRTLSQRGHQVTVFTTHPMNDPTLTNLTEVDLSSINSVVNFTDVFISASNTLHGYLNYYWVLTEAIPRLVLEHSSIQRLIHESNQFDLVMVESVIWSMYAFSKKFNCPLIAIASLTCSGQSYNQVGNPEAMLLPEDKLFNPNATIFQRLQHIVSERLDKFLLHLGWINTNLLLEKHFGKGYADLQEHFDRISMVFENANNILYQIRPFLPSVIQIDGLNLYHNHPNLTQDLQRRLDNASNGFIYVSLGSLINTNEFLNELLLDTFRTLPYTVVWKNDQSLNLPNHVTTSKWLPQFNILRHKNIKLFIMQCGTHSLLESVYNEVPVIGLPLYLDQFSNADKIRAFGIGLTLNYNDLNKTLFESKILEVARNPSYKENVIKLSRMIKDQPQTGLDRAVFWTEYVIRHNGTRHFRKPTLDVPFYKYYSLDILVLLVFIFVLAFYAFRGAVSAAKKLVFTAKSKKE